MLKRIEKIVAVLTDKSALNRAIAFYQKGMTSGDREIYSDDDYRAENMLAAVEVMKHYNGHVDYNDLLQNHQLMAPLLDMAERHINDGTRLDLLLGVTKNYNLCYEYMLHESEIETGEVLDFIMNYRKVFDAFELIAMKKWFMQTTENYYQSLNNLKLDIEFAETQFRAIVETFDYPVIVVDMDGRIKMLNREGYKYFAVMDSLDKQLCSLLDYHFVNFHEFVKSYGRDTDKYVRFMNGEQFLTRLVKLSSSAYTFSMIPVHDKEMVKNLKEQLTGLSPAETVVCSYIVRGLSTKEIADELFISIDTVNSHRKNIRRKLGLVGRNESIVKKLDGIKDVKF